MISHLLLKSRIRGYLELFSKRDFLFTLAEDLTGYYNYCELHSFIDFNCKEICFNDTYSENGRCFTRSGLSIISKFSALNRFACFLEYYFDISISKTIRVTYQETYGKTKYHLKMFFKSKSNIKQGVYLLWDKEIFGKDLSKYFKPDQINYNLIELNLREEKDPILEFYTFPKIHVSKNTIILQTNI